MVKNLCSTEEEVVEKTDVDILIKMMTELGISMSNGDTYKLILWNDDVNDMVYVATALFEICELDSQECVKVMLEAHEKGKAVAKSGDYEEVIKMKEQFDLRKIQTSVEK